MNKTYRISLQSKIASLAYFLFFLFFIFVLFAGPGIFRDPVKWFFYTLYLVNISIFVWLGLILLIVIVIAFMIYRRTQYSVSIGTESILLNLPIYYGSKQMQNGRLYNTIKFADITRAVYMRFSQSIRIYSQTHMMRIIPLSSFDEKDELLEIIKNRLGEKFVLSQTIIDPLVLPQVATIIMSVILFTTYIIEPFDFLSVWTPVIEKPFMTFLNVRAYSLDEDVQSVWILSEKGFSDELQVWKANGHNIQVWDGLQSSYPYGQISHDENGNPVVIRENEITRWKNGVWASEPLAPPQSSISFRAHPTVYGSQFWNDYGTVSGKDFVTGKIETLYPTPVADATAHGFRINPDGSLLVLIEKEDNGYLYQFKDNLWVEPGYSLGHIYPVFDLIDYFLDASGVPWALREIHENDKREYRVGYFSIEKNEWNWISLSPYSLRGEEFYSLQVDQRGRLWLEGHVDYREFVRVYDVLPNGLYEIVEYDEYNSNLETEIPITLGLDGKMWIAGNTLSYIDSNAPDLPKPAPDWLAAMGTITVRMVITFAYLSAAIWMSVAQTRASRKKQ